MIPGLHFIPSCPYTKLAMLNAKRAVLCIRKTMGAGVVQTQVPGSVAPAGSFSQAWPPDNPFTSQHCFNISLQCLAQSKIQGNAQLDLSEPFYQTCNKFEAPPSSKL